MAAGAWKLNQYGKFKIGNATINLSNATDFRLGLYTSGASANIAGDISIQSSIGSEATGGGYAAGGTSLSSPTWTQTGTSVRWDASDWIVTGSIAAIKYAYIVFSVGATSGHLLCYSTLSANVFALTGTNTMTIQMNAAGIFSLN